jgi:succinyl-CoA synthetase beta subunit
MNAPLVTRALDEYEAKKLLASYGVPVVAEEKTGSVGDALQIADRLGYPIVLKGCGSAFLHKTEMGLVHLNLRNAAEVRAAAEQALTAMKGQGALLVQRMLRGEREFLAGMSRDKQFGPIISFGVGGIFTEALADVALRLCPLDQANAAAMLDEIRARAILGAYRGLLPVNRKSLIASLCGLSRLALERPEIAAIDINPLIVSGAEPIAVDALVILQ